MKQLTKHTNTPKPVGFLCIGEFLPLKVSISNNDMLHFESKQTTDSWYVNGVLNPQSLVDVVAHY